MQNRGNTKIKMEGPTSKNTKQPPERANHKGNIKLLFIGCLLKSSLTGVLHSIWLYSLFGLFDFDLTLVWHPFWLLWLWIYQCWRKNERIKQGFKLVLGLNPWKELHWVIPFMKPGCRVSYNVRTGPLKPWWNTYFNFIETLAGY
jgi:hypothetical protein